MAEHGLGGGAMALIAAAPDKVAALLDGTAAVIACENAPEECIVAGLAAEVAAVVARTKALGIREHALRVSHAFHSPLVAPAAAPVGRMVAAEPSAPLTRTVFSTVTGAALPADADLAALVERQMTAPVRFRDALAQAVAGADLAIEVGPGTGMTRLAGTMAGCPAIALEAGGPSIAGLLLAAGAGFVLGAAGRVSALYEDRFTRPFDLDRPRRFLANPCESAPVDGVRTARARPARMDRAPAKAVEAGLSPLDTLRAVIARKLDLDISAIAPEHGLLRDLHLNSIAVGQLVAEAARAMGFAPPANPSNFASVTVAEAAAALSASAVPLDSAPDPFPAGVDSWMRLFGAHLVERPLTVQGTGPEAWRVFGPAAHPARGLLRESSSATAIAICVPVDPDEAALEALFAGARAAGPEGLVLVLQQGGGGAALARCLSLETPGLAVRVADLPFAHPGAPAWIAAEAEAATPGYAEAHYDASGVRRVPVTRLLSWHPEGGRPEGGRPEERHPAESHAALGPADVILASGGAKGIGAECAMALAKATGARLGLVGRSAADAPEVRATLARLRAEQVPASYARADVTDAAAVNAAVASIEADLGPVTALLHAAGINDPAPIQRLEMDAVRRTVAVKLGGLRNLLAAVAPDRLRLLAGFGSIIGHHGLAGEAHYALANEWMERAVRAFGAAHPDCHCVSPGWSAWSGVGMADRLGVVEALDRSGVSALAPAPATALFVALTRTAPMEPFVVAGRFGAPPTVDLDPPPLQGRFLEKPAVHYPGVELVAGTTLTPARDPYVDDHALAGTRLFPAVLGLEAMARAAEALTGTRPALLEGLVFQRPIAVGDGGTDIRVAALLREDGSVSTAVRTRDTGFQADHFAGIAHAKAAQEEPAPACYRRTGEAELDQTVLYEHLLFHAGRFRRVESYDFLSATACIARLRPAGPNERWFPDRGQDDLLLGDPGARDAALHALQAAIPHRRILPASVRRIRLGVLRPDETYTVHGRETGRDGDSFIWDVELHAEDGTLAESWEGLELKAIEPLAAPPAWPPALAACMLERRLQAFLPDNAVRLTLIPGGAADAALAWVLEPGEIIRRRPDGRPEADRPVSVSHANGLTLAIAAGTAAGCDLEPVVARDGQTWRDLLGPDGTALAHAIVKEAKERFDQAATRVWCVREAVKKAGGTAAPVLDRVEDSWVLFRAGSFLVPTWAGVMGVDPHVVAAAIGASSAPRAKPAAVEPAPRAAGTEGARPEGAPVYSYRHTVSFKDTNLVGNVYFTNHLDWQGRCREMFLRDKAPSVLRELREGLALVTVRCACDYVAELDAFDEVRVDMRLARLHEDRIDLAFTYWRCHPDGDEVIATGRQDVACLRTVNGVKGPTPVPRELVEALRPYRTGPEAPGSARADALPMA